MPLSLIHKLYILFMGLLYALPPLLSSLYTTHFSFIWLFSSLFLGVLLVVLRMGIRHKVTGYVLMCIGGVAGLLNGLALTSYWLQGTGITPEVFWHFDMTNLLVILRGFSIEFLLGIVLVALSVPYALRSVSIKPVYKGIIGVLIILLLAVFQPLTDTIGVFSNGSFAKSSEDVISKYFHNRKLSSSVQFSRTKPDILVIYLESFERTYFDTSLFGNIAPNLKRELRMSVQFTGIRKMPGTGWTIASIFSSHCGYPLMTYSPGNQILATFKPDKLGAGSWSSILQKNGYETVYMGGADTVFAGKREFLKNNGYTEIYGFTELKKKLKNPKHHNHWGLYDESLFPMVLEKIEDLSSRKKPFLLTTLTMDTHHPYGMPSPGIRKVSDNDMINAVHGSDAVIGTFLRKLREKKLDSNLMIVFVSDHLAMRNTVSDILAKAESRDHTFAIRAPWLTSRLIETDATHFDMGPTILEAAGISDFGNFPLGQSLLSNRYGYMKTANLTAAHFKGFDIVKLSSSYNIRTSPIILDSDNRKISIGSDTIPVTHEGEELYAKQVFGMEFDVDTGIPGSAVTMSLDQELVEGDEEKLYMRIVQSEFECKPDKLWITYSPVYGFSLFSGTGGVMLPRGELHRLTYSKIIKIFSENNIKIAGKRQDSSVLQKNP